MDGSDLAPMGAVRPPGQSGGFSPGCLCALLGDQYSAISRQGSRTSNNRKLSSLGRDAPGSGVCNEELGLKTI